MKAKDAGYSVYMIQNPKGTIYTGISNNVTARIRAHNTNKGAKFTRGKGPWVLIGIQACVDRSHALSVEMYLKTTHNHGRKLEWCAAHPCKKEESA